MTMLERLAAGERTFTPQEYQDLCYEVFVLYEAEQMSAEVADTIVLERLYNGEKYEVI